MAVPGSTRRVALVTGGAKRVGRAVVERLARGGFDIAFTYLSSEKEAAALCASLADRVVLPVKADLTNRAGVEAAIEAVHRQFSRLDVLVNNASIYVPGVDPQEMRRMWAIHVETPLQLCQHFGPALRSAGGYVVNMVDLLAERPWPRYAGYSATKAGLWNLTLSLARELAPEVKVNGIAPGVVEWPGDYPLAEREKYLKRVPLGRAGTPQDVAEAVHFLCTSGNYLTGQILRLDGGRSLT